MSKVDEFNDQLVEVERKLSEYHELRNDLKKRISEIDSNGLHLGKDQLHKLLCYLTHSIIPHEVVSDSPRKDLIDFSHELQWSIAELFGYDLNEGDIDPETNEFYTFKSRW